MLESGSSGSVRGASRNGRPYREPAPEGDIHRSIRDVRLTSIRDVAPNVSKAQIPVVATR